jgi:arachidonate 15-lipoxygenase
MQSSKSDKKLAASAKRELALPQNCTKKQLKERQKEVGSSRKSYTFDHSWKGYPPSIKHLPLREIPPMGVVKLIESGFNLEASRLEQEFRRAMDKITRLGRKEKPFDKYTVLYSSKTLPEIGKKDEWQFDAVFAAQRLNGMYPWFIERVENLAELQKEFPITNERVEGLLPRKATLEDLQNEGRLYVVSQPSLDGAKPAHDHVMTAPTTLFYVSNLGQLMPIGIQLYPKTTATNPVFTPNDDPETWLAVKIHAACADTLVHSIYSHAILMHFVMCNVWTSANRTLSTQHPVHAFLKPHFWSTLFVTKAVKSSMDSKKGSQILVYGTGLKGQNTMVKSLYREFDFQNYNPHVDFKNRGVDDVEKLPGFLYRDDALELWKADHDYIEEMMGLFYTSDDDVKNDVELQAWMADMASEKGAGIRGLPVGDNGKMETREQLHLMLTSILFTVTSRHSSIENGALEYLYVPANPFVYRMDAPTKSTKKTKLREVAKNLPPIKQAIHGYALIATANFDHHKKFSKLGRYDSDFMKGSPRGVKAIVRRWNQALVKISREIDARNEKLLVPYTGVKPTHSFNSIWN